MYSPLRNGNSEKKKRSTFLKRDRERSVVNMVDLQSFNTYLKVSWMKTLTSNLDGDWHKLIIFKLQIFGGERIMNFQNENKRKIAVILINPFCKDVQSSYHLAKTLYKVKYWWILSLDILSLVPVTDLTDIRWIDHNVQYLCDLVDPTYW